MATCSRRRAVISSVAAASVSLQPPVFASASSIAGMPAIGLGTCCDNYEDSYAAAVAGLNAGFRLVDTAAHYESEPAVGDALASWRADGGVRTVTKVWFDDMGFEPALASARRSMSNLKMEQLDILLIHFPGSIDAVQSPARNRKLRQETWRALETLLADGHCRSIGVSNYNRRHLKETLASCRVQPMVLQTELHPRWPQSELVDYARECGVASIMAHCPLAHGSPALLASQTLARLAQERGNGCTPAQLCLRWSIDKGFIPIPHATSAARLRENLAAASLDPLSATERLAIDALEATGSEARVSFDPSLIV